MYPLMTNDRKLTAAQVLEVHKGQPMIEKRFEQIKTVHEVAPVFLKDEGRIEALFTLYARRSTRGRQHSAGLIARIAKRVT